MFPPLIAVGNSELLHHLVCKGGVVCHSAPCQHWDTRSRAAKEVALSQREPSWPSCPVGSQQPMVGLLGECKDLAFLPKKVQFWMAVQGPELIGDRPESLQWLHQGLAPASTQTCFLYPHRCWSQGHSLVNFMRENFHFRLHFLQDTTHTFCKSLFTKSSLIIHSECAICFLPRCWQIYSLFSYQSIW